MENYSYPDCHISAIELLANYAEDRVFPGMSDRYNDSCETFLVGLAHVMIAHGNDPATIFEYLDSAIEMYQNAYRYGLI